MVLRLPQFPEVRGLPVLLGVDGVGLDDHGLLDEVERVLELGVVQGAGGGGAEEPLEAVLRLHGGHHLNGHDLILNLSDLVKVLVLAVYVQSLPLASVVIFLPPVASLEKENY